MKALTNRLILFGKIAKRMRFAVSAQSNAGLSYIPIEQQTDPNADNLHMEDIESALLSSSVYKNASIGHREYIAKAVSRYGRILQDMRKSGQAFSGPTLDVASGYGIMYPLFKRYFPSMLPYRIAELFENSDLEIDEELIPCLKYECERDRLPLDDESLGVVVFCDTLEHLIVDPMHTLIEFNRVLRDGGHVVLSTPNAAAIQRVRAILDGRNPATETAYKPCAIYQRHNREWTPDEVARVMELCGFGEVHIGTGVVESVPAAHLMRAMGKVLGIPMKPLSYFGPEIVCVARKTEHLPPVEEWPKERRWPEWLYTKHDTFRKRPKVFPINVSDDFY